MMGIEEDICWDELWVLYGNQFDNKFHIRKQKLLVIPEFMGQPKKKKKTKTTNKLIQLKVGCVFSVYFTA